MRELAPELALDVLTGYERATAQAHLGVCPLCREYVGSLTHIGDRLLTLVPGVEPPVGFEDRVLATMGFPAQRQPRQRRRWWPMAVAAAAVIAVVSGVGGWVASETTDKGTTTVASANSQVLRFAQFRSSDQRQVGQVFAYGGSPWWVYMSVTSSTASTVSCELLEQDGKYLPIGTFQLSGGKGSWGQEVAVDPSTVVGARLVSDHGAVLATATFGVTTTYPSTQGPK
jgi:hypothetical protein